MTTSWRVRPGDVAAARKPLRGISSLTSATDTRPFPVISPETAAIAPGSSWFVEPHCV